MIHLLVWGRRSLAVLRVWIGRLTRWSMVHAGVLIVGGAGWPRLVFAVCSPAARARYGVSLSVVAHRGVIGF